MKKGKTSGDCINRNREGTQKSISHVTPNEIQRTYVSSSIVEPTPIRHPNKPPTRRTRAKQCQAKTKSAIYLIYWCMRAPRRSYLQTDTRASRGGWVLAARSKFTTSSKNRRKVSLLLPRKRYSSHITFIQFGDMRSSNITPFAAHAFPWQHKQRYSGRKGTVLYVLLSRQILECTIHCHSKFIHHKL